MFCSMSDPCVAHFSFAFEPLFCFLWISFVNDWFVVDFFIFSVELCCGALTKVLPLVTAKACSYERCIHKNTNQQKHGAQLKRHSKILPRVSSFLFNFSGDATHCILTSP